MLKMGMFGMFRTLIKKKHTRKEATRMFGVYNSVKKEFQFGICALSEVKANKLLFKKIGHDAKKWRFEVRLLPKGHEYLKKFDDDLSKLATAILVSAQEDSDMDSFIFIKDKIEKFIRHRLR